MATLTLRLAAPLQSWGTSSRFVRRLAGDVPSKSGVIGMLAAAQGRRRMDELTDLLGLSFAVRVDQAGTLVRDFQTARSLDGSEVMPLSERFYQSDAIYVAAVEGPGELLEDLKTAVSKPVFPLFLGRRSCPPAGLVHAAVDHDADLMGALAKRPWEVAGWRAKLSTPTVRLDVYRDAAEAKENGNLSRDVPISFDPAFRRYSWRSVVPDEVHAPNPHARAEGEPKFSPHADHDPMSELEA